MISKSSQLPFFIFAHNLVGIDQKGSGLPVKDRFPIRYMKNCLGYVHGELSLFRAMGLYSFEIAALYACLLLYSPA